MHRTGVKTPAAALELARGIEKIAGLRVDGLFCYPGHIWDKSDAQDKPLGVVARLLLEAIELFQANGFSTAIVSGGSTPSAYQSGQTPQLTEIRSGTYIFNDMNTVYGGYCSLEDCAASLICTVVSDAVPGQIVLDAGSKTLTNDRCFPRPDSGFGFIVEYPDAKIIALSEEHGQVDITACAAAPKVGERVTVIPNHICPCVNLQDRMWLDTGGELEPISVDARGKVY
jgi:D-serine deaminase-like pyridoxal phosphate-dependent protein